jgi:hypothetical protein
MSLLVSFYVYLPLVFARNLGFQNLSCTDSQWKECEQYLYEFIMTSLRYIVTFV